MKNPDCRKLSRGQVWFLVDQDVPAVHYQGSVQGKNRPWLIVSNNICNQNSTVYTAVPLTSQPKNNLPTHVTYQIDDKTHTILCEQLRSVPERVFYNSGSSYRYCLSEELMQKVDEALSIQLGLSLIMPNAERFWSSIERMIRLKVKELLRSTEIDSLDIVKVSALIDKRTDELLQGLNKEPAEPVEQIKPVEQVQPEISPAPIKKAGRNVWNEANKKQFLDDYYKHGTDYVMAAYNMSRHSVYAMRGKIKKELNDGTT